MENRWQNNEQGFVHQQPEPGGYQSIKGAANAKGETRNGKRQHNDSHAGDSKIC